MNLIAILDSLAFFCLLVALAILLFRWKPGPSADIKMPILFLLVIEGIHRFSNAAMWADITPVIEHYEPFFQAAIPLLYLFLFFGFVQVKQKRQLLDTEQLFLDISNQIADVIYITDTKGIITYMSPSAMKIFQFPGDSAVGKPFSELLDKGETIDPVQFFKGTMASGKCFTPLTVQMQRENGRTVTAEVNGSRLMKEGKVSGIIGIIRNVSQRIKAEERLRKSEERFRALSENSQDIIMRFDRDIRHLYTNSAVETQTNIPASEFIGRTHEEMGFPQELCDLWSTAIREVFETAEHKRIEFQLPTGVYIDWMLLPEFDANGKVSAVMTSARDISNIKLAIQEKEKLEGQLRQSQKMEAIGRLAGGVAHDFNNLLTNIIGNSEMLMEDKSDDLPREQMLAEMNRSARMAADLTQRLLAFSRKQIIQLKTVNLNTIVSGLENMLGRLIGEHIAISTKLSPGLGFSQVDPGQIEQVILNLVVNARDALSQGGKIEIETRVASLDNAFIESTFKDDGIDHKHFDTKPGLYSLLIVKDSGEGISKEDQTKIFEPFFTTKPEGKGTGLGLSTVYGIIKQHGGAILVDSEVGNGTAFSIYLPQIDPGEDA